MKKATVSYLDFEKLDFRIGEVKEASILEGSRSLIKMLVDLGEIMGWSKSSPGLQNFMRPKTCLETNIFFWLISNPRSLWVAIPTGWSWSQTIPKNSNLSLLTKS